MTEGFVVTSAALEQHARSVAALVGAVDGARAAAVSVTVADEAYGRLCSWLPPRIRPVQENAVAVLLLAAAALDATSLGLSRTALGYSAIDAGVASGLDRLTPR